MPNNMDPKDSTRFAMMLSVLVLLLQNVVEPTLVLRDAPCCDEGIHIPISHENHDMLITIATIVSTFLHNFMVSNSKLMFWND